MLEAEEEGKGPLHRDKALGSFYLAIGRVAHGFTEFGSSWSEPMPRDRDHTGEEEEERMGEKKNDFGSYMYLL